MAGLLDTAVSGLRAYQSALTTVSHNISNVNTDGYSRQTVELNAREPQTFGSISVGQGVELTSITRVIDEFNSNNIREFQSSFSRLDMFNTFSSRVENIVADEQGSLMPAMDSFFNAMDDVANDPSSNAPRVVLTGQADNLQQRFNSLATELQQLSKEVDNRIVSEVNDINALTTEIARVNDSITRSNSTNAQPNDLLDRRDSLLKDLSEKLSVTVVKQTDGTLNVLAGTGQLLVTGSISINLSTQADVFQPDRLAVTLVSGGSSIDISNTISGGELGGLLDFRNNMLDSAQNRLGRTAIALSDSFNNVHRQGYDLNGNIGGDFFSAGTPQVLNKTTNTGSGAVAVTISDSTAITVSDYEVRFAGGNYNIVRLSDNASVGSGVFANPTNVTADGLAFNLTGAPAAGDSFYVRPTRTGATDFQALITDTAAIAAAAPIRTISSSANIGDIDISAGTVIDSTNASLLNTVTMTIDAAGQIDLIDTTLLPAPGQPISVDVTRPSTGTTVTTINPSSNIVYEAGMTITANGWQVQLTGNAPQPGDVLTVQENTGAATDNRNALSLASLRSQGVLDGATKTFEQDYGALTAEVGGVAQQININLDVESSLLSNAMQERESISGVNLDEEAANLIRFQQAYQALARVIQTAQATFQSLLEAT